jgi:mannan endo-1,4-beta-mannosidase
VGFIRSDGKQLLRDGRPWRFVLGNAYYLADEVGQGSPEHALESLDAAVALGMGVVRTWAFNDAPWKQSRMQEQLGAPYEPGLCALDRVVAEAARRGLRLILPLVDYWPWYGGIAQWLAWRGQPVAAGDRDHPERYAARFFADAQLRDAYRLRVRQLATRTNTVTGLRYGDDPTILAWELMNEARQAPADWIDFAADAVREHCNQLIALGDESACDAAVLDLASLHFYPEKHGGRGDELRFGREVITAAAARVTRPLVVGEFGLRNNGLSLAERRRAYDAWFACAAGHEIVAGMGPWLLGHRSRRPEADEFFTFYASGDYDATFARANTLFSEKFC